MLAPQRGTTMTIEADGFTEVTHAEASSTYLHQLVAFRDAVQLGAVYPTTAADGVANMAVIDGCYRALRVGGWLLIVDETYPSTLAETRQPEYLFPMQTGFEELTWGNVLPTRKEQEKLLRTAGFQSEIGRSIVGEGFTVLSVHK